MNEIERKVYDTIIKMSEQTICVEECSETVYFFSKSFLDKAAHLTFEICDLFGADNVQARTVLSEVFDLHKQLLCEQVFLCNVHKVSIELNTIALWRIGALCWYRLCLGAHFGNVDTAALIQILCELSRVAENKQYRIPSCDVSVELFALGRLNEEEYIGKFSKLASVITPQLSEYGLINNNFFRQFAHPIDEKIIDTLDRGSMRMAAKAALDGSSAATWGQIIASGIPVNNKNYPEINDIVNDCCKKIGIKKPYTIISNSIGGINACTFGSDENPYLMLSPLLVKVMGDGENGNSKIKFVIGHECGHIAMGHVLYHAVVSTMGQLLLGNKISAITTALKSWSRRSEISADRAGLMCCGDIDVAKRVILQLEAGVLSADDLDVDNYIECNKQYLEGSFLPKLGEFKASHPLSYKRIQALDIYKTSKSFCRMFGLPQTASCISDEELKEKTEEILRVL